MFASDEVICVFRNLSIFQMELASSCHFMLYVYLQIYRRAKIVNKLRFRD